MAERVKVAVFGTGGVGAACVKEILRAPELGLDLVAVLVHSPEKEGKDAGEIVGLPKCDILATRDREQVFAKRPACILYALKDPGDFSFDGEIIEFLSRGVNVVTSLPYHYLGNRPPQVVAALRDACEMGNSSLFATGVNPGLLFERFALTAAGASNDITSVTVEEFVKIGTEPAHTLKAFGFGIPFDQARQSEGVRLIAEQYFGQSIRILGAMLGTPVQGALTHLGDWRVATKRVITPTLDIAPGEVEYISHRWSAKPEGGPEIAVQLNWYLTDDQQPEGVPCEDFYVITVEGRPSIRLKVELRASIRDYIRLYPGDPTVPVYYATAVPMVQAVAATVASRPGIIGTRPPSNGHWRQDMLQPPKALPDMI